MELLQNGALQYGYPNLNDWNGGTALHLAVAQYNVRPIDILLNHGAQIDAATEYRLETPLMHAAKKSNRLAMNALLSRKANPNMRNNWRQTALHFAVAQNDVRALEILLNHGAEIDVADDEFETPLMNAVKKKFLDVITRF